VVDSFSKDNFHVVVLSGYSFLGRRFEEEDSNCDNFVLFGLFCGREGGRTLVVDSSSEYGLI